MRCILAGLEKTSRWLVIELERLPLGTLLQLGKAAVIELTGQRTPCVLIDRFQAGLKDCMIRTGKSGRGSSAAFSAWFGLAAGSHRETLCAGGNSTRAAAGVAGSVGFRRPSDGAEKNPRNWGFAGGHGVGWAPFLDFGFYRKLSRISCPYRPLLCRSGAVAPVEAAIRNAGKFERPPRMPPHEDADVGLETADDGLDACRWDNGQVWFLTPSRASPNRRAAGSSCPGVRSSKFEDSTLSRSAGLSPQHGLSAASSGVRIGGHRHKKPNLPSGQTRACARWPCNRQATG
jgi:hypothetical protein